MPAPMPCRPRNRISWPMPSSGRKVSLPAAPHSADVATKSVAPTQKERLASVDVGQAGEDRHRHGRRQQVGGGDPRIAIEARELRDDARLGRADDRLIDGREQRARAAARSSCRPAAAASAARFRMCGTWSRPLPSRQHLPSAPRASSPRGRDVDGDHHLHLCGDAVDNGGRVVPVAYGAQRFVIEQWNRSEDRRISDAA